MKVGIFGLPGSGKTSLWCLLADAVEGPDPAMIGKLQLRTVKVSDPRLERLRDDYQPKKYTPATVEIGDFPGVAVDDYDRAGLAQLLAPARNMDALLIVIRDFDSALRPPHLGSVDPVKEWDEIQTEFLLSDLAIVEKRVDKLVVQVKKPTPTQQQDRQELELLTRVRTHLEEEKPLLDFKFNADELKRVTGFQFLSLKPMVPVMNRGDSPPSDERLQEVEERIQRPVFTLNAANEFEILQLSPEDQDVFREELGVEPGSRERIIAACYRAAGLISFFTCGDKEVRAWTIRDADPAVVAAEQIHSDIARGFIRAETVSYDDYLEHGGLKGAKEKGVLRLEGKEYVMQDGDIVEFRFNV
jgi:GTP-binding protein YchF